jgi:hypothetical protein
MPLPAAALLLILITLAQAAPALASGSPPPPAQVGPDCPARPAVPHPRASDVPLRGERPAPARGCHRHGILHRLFHGHRR